MGRATKKKWPYVFLYGVVYLGLPIGCLMYLFENNFVIENVHFFDVIREIGFGIIIGLVIVLFNFNSLDKLYLSNKINIINGIKRLNTGKVWEYESLIISKVNNETLIIRNKLFWFDKSKDNTDKINECFDAVKSDYLEICKEKKFRKFSKRYKVRIQIFDVLYGEIPLIDKEI